MKAIITTIVFMLLTGCATNPSVVDNLEKLATPENCFWHGVDIPNDAAQTGKILIKNEPFSMWGDLAAVERECGEQYPTPIGGCVKAINSNDFPAPDHQYEIVFMDQCSAMHEACHALYEVDNERHSVPSILRMMQGDWQWACPPTVHNMPWRKVELPELTDDDYANGRFHESINP